MQADIILALGSESQPNDIVGQGIIKGNKKIEYIGYRDEAADTVLYIFCMPLRNNDKKKYPVNIASCALQTGGCFLLPG